MINFNITPASFGQRPQVELPDAGFLKLLGEEGIRELVSKHYDALVVSDIKHLFPTNKHELEMAKKHSADFFVQICGGHPYFNENRGAPRMIQRHMKFSIRSKDRLVWLKCYQQVLQNIKLPDSVMTSFWNYLNVFSIWMINSPD